MACTESDIMRRALHREVAGTIGLLTDEEDFQAMRRYRSFTFDDHRTYLHQAEGLLRSLAAQGRHTAVALFDPGEYEEFCTETGLDPDSPGSRTRFTAELAATGSTVRYEGQPFAELVPDLVTEAARQAAWEYATRLLADIGACAVCGEDIGWAAYTRASDLLVRVLTAAGPGAHHLVCSVSAASDTLLATLQAASEDPGGTSLDEAEAREFVTVLAAGIASRTAGGLVMRTRTAGAQDRVYGWRLQDSGLRPLTAGEVFDAYCTDGDSGDLVSPESGVDYCPPPDLADPGPPPGHRH